MSLMNTASEQKRTTMDLCIMAEVLMTVTLTSLVLQGLLLLMPDFDSHAQMQVCLHSL